MAPFTASPLVVYRATKPCTGCGEDVTLTTDGTRYYAVTNTTASVPWERVGEVVTVACGTWMEWDAPCNCGVEFDLSDDTAWTGDPVFTALVQDYGRPLGASVELMNSDDG